MAKKKTTKKAVVKNTTKKAVSKKKTAKRAPVSRKKISPVHIVAVGASAGGLDAFKNLLTSMPVDTGLAFVLIQHLDPTHESMMVELLSRHTQMNVVEVKEDMRVKANHIYMIPINKDMAIHNNKFILTKPSLPRGIRMPIDYFMNSLAEEQQDLAISIILSGTGSDGTLGLKSIKSFGGMVMVQEPSDAQYDGMPVSAISTGIVDYVTRVRTRCRAC